MNNPTLVIKLAQIMAELKRLGRDGSQPGFRYSTIDNVVDTIRPRLADKQIMLFSSMINAEQNEITSSKGKTGRHTVATFEFTFVDGDSGESLKFQWTAETDDYSDKGLNQVSAFALKYFLIRTFLLSTGDEADDPDHKSVDVGAPWWQTDEFAEKVAASGFTNDEVLSILKVNDIANYPGNMRQAVTELRKEWKRRNPDPSETVEDTPPGPPAQPVGNGKPEQPTLPGTPEASHYNL